jgi:hypothetical protein
VNWHQPRGDNDQNRPVRFSRRTLLRLGAAGLVSLAFAPAVGAGQAAIRSTSQPATLPITIGYAPFADDGEEATIIDAESLGSGQSHFPHSSASLKLHGFCTDKAETRVAQVEKLSIDVSFAPFHDIVFRAWSFQNSIPASSSCPTAMTVPIAASHGLNMNLTVQQTADSPTLHIPLQLAANGSDKPKLREGHYFLGMPGQDSSVPKWDDYVLRNDPDIPVVTRLASSGASARTSGPVFMFSVGSAS